MAVFINASDADTTIPDEPVAKPKPAPTPVVRAAPPPRPVAAAPVLDQGDNGFSEDDAAKLIASIPGATITSEYRDPTHNEDVGGVKGSMHTRGTGEAIDFKKPPGMTKEQFAAVLQSKGLPATELIDEGTHIHWAWGKKGGAGASSGAPAVPGADPTISPEHQAAITRVAEVERDVGKSDSNFRAQIEKYNRELEANQKEVDRLDAERDSLKPPTLEKAPKAPKEIESKPTQVLGQFLPMLAMLAGARSRAPATAALSAAAAAMNARRKNDHEAFQESHEAWKDAMEEAHTNFTQERDQYLDALKAKDVAIEERIARLRTTALEFGNEKMLNSIDHGRLDQAVDMLKMADVADWHVYQVKIQADKQELAQKGEQLRERLADSTIRYREENSGLGKLKAAEKLRQEVIKGPTGKVYAEVQHYMPVIKGAADAIAAGRPLTSQQQAALLEAQTRMITNQAIRSFTLKLNQEHAGVSDKLQVMLQNLAQGGPIDKKQAKNLIDVANQYAAAVSQEMKGELARQDKFAMSGGIGGDQLPSQAFDMGEMDAAAGGGIADVPDEAIKELRANDTPEMRKHFDSAFQAPGLADRILGG